MIRLWVLLADEPPTTEVDPGRAVSLTCRWAPLTGSMILAEFGTRLPSVAVVEREGVPRVVSGQSRDFEAYPDIGPDLGMPSVEWAQSPCVAHEDKYLEPFLRRSVPEFAGVVEEVRYLWSPTWPKGNVDQVTADSANPAPGSLYAVGKLVSVTVK